MTERSRRTTGALLGGALLLSGCGWFGGNTEVIELSGDRITVDGITSDPLDDPVVAATVDTPAGTLVIETYESELGGCYRLRPDGADETGLPERVGCLRGSGIHPERAVTGTPDGSIEAINGGATNLAMFDAASEVGIFHHGLAHPSVATITIETEDGAGVALGGFPIVDAPNVPGLRVFLAWSPPHLDAYRLSAYDEDGCLLDSDETRVTGGPDGGPQVMDLRPSCETRLPSQIRDVDVTVR